LGNANEHLQRNKIQNLKVATASMDGILIRPGETFSLWKVIGRSTRVLYLYHYFIPLVVSFVVLGLVFDELQNFGKKVLNEHGKTVIALVLAALIFGAHQYYRPFTYYEPLTDAQFARRNIFNLWELRCVNCEHHSGIVIPTK
jgi:hypothetical protein